MTAGSKGLFGLGKKAPQYEVKIIRPKSVSVTYRQKAKIRLQLEDKQTQLEKVINTWDSLGSSKITDRLLALDAPPEVRQQAARLIVARANQHNEPQYGPDGESYPGARFSAALDLAKLNATSEVDELIAWLQDRDPDTRRNVALALGALAATAAVEALLECALHDEYIVHLGDSYRASGALCRTLRRQFGAAPHR